MVTCKEAVKGNQSICNSTTISGNTLIQSGNVGRLAERVRESDGYSRLDVNIERIVAQSQKLSAEKRRRQEIEAQGKIVREFNVGNTRIKINDAYCRDKTPEDVEKILAGIAAKAQAALTAQHYAKEQNKK